MKKFIYSVLILIFTLGIGSTCFGGVGITTTNELEGFLACYGYDIDFEAATFYNTNEYYGTYSKFISWLSDTSAPLIIFSMEDAYFRHWDSSLYEFNDSIDFVIYQYYTTDVTKRKITLKNDSEKGYCYYLNFTSYCYAVDVDNNIVYYPGGNYYYHSDNWVENTSNVSHEEFISSSYQKYLLENYNLIYCESNFYGNDKNILFYNQGGKITNNTVNDITYKGTLTYNPSTEICSINLTSGFESGTEYKIFLEEWTITNDEEYGLLGYFDRVVWEESIMSSTTEVTFYKNYFYEESDQVYRICIGEIGTETNTIYLCTDWLLPNSNTVRLYPNFSTWHYMDLLNIIEYDPDEEIPDVSDTPSGDTESGDNTSGDSGGVISPSGDISGDSTEDDIEEIKSGIGGILQNIIELPGKIISGLLEGIKSLFIPDDDFFENYWNDLYEFFSNKLGFLWDVVMFIPEFFDNFKTVVEAQIGNVNFDIPTLSVPDFQGSEVVILEGFNWSFTDYINQNQELSNLYDLYLDLIDFFVGVALVGYALSVISSIFEIQTPGEAQSGEGVKIEGK